MVNKRLSDEVQNQDIEDSLDGTSSSSESSYLKELNKILTHPFLSLLEVYLSKSEPKRQSIHTTLKNFKDKHQKSYVCLFFADLLLKLFYLLIFVVITLRGLGLLDLSKLL